MNRFLQSCFFILTLIIALPAFGQLPKGPGFPGINEAEMKQLEAEMAAFQKEIEALSPQEQESFFKSMEQAVKRIDDLSKTDEGKALLDKLDKGEITDAELDQLINQIVEEEPAAEQKAAPEPKPAEQKKAEPAIKPITSQEQQAINIINDIIHHTNSFIIKAVIMPELPGKIAAWQKKKQIEWRPDLSWNVFKKNLESFVENLNTLITRDSKTKAFVHLEKLLSNEPLYNNIKKVHRVVSQQEPAIEEQLPLSGTMSKSSKKAFQKMINQYIEALYVLNLPQELKQLFTHYEPKAKEAREAEEKARKEADIASRRKLQPGAPVVVGTGDVDFGPSPVDYGDYERPYRSRRSYSAPATQPSSYDSVRGAAAPAGRPAKKASGKKGKAAVDEEEEEDGELQEGQEKTQKAQEPKDEKLETLLKKADEIDKEMFSEGDKLLDRVAANLEVVALAIKDSKVLQNLNDNLTAEAPVDVAFATEVLPDVIRELSLRKGAIGNIKQLETKLTPVARTTYKKKLEQEYAKHKNQIDGLLDQLQNLGDDALEKMGIEKRYAYFAQEPEQVDVAEQNIDELLKQVEAASTSLDDGLSKAVSAIEMPAPAEDPLKDIKGKIPTPYSLSELKETIQELKMAIEEFGKTTQPAQRKKK